MLTATLLTLLNTAAAVPASADLGVIAQVSSEVPESAAPHIKRLRLIPEAAIGQVRGRVHFDFARGVELIEAWVDAPVGEARAKLGVQKIPFTWYRAASFRELATADWSLTTTTFGAEHQLGLRFDGGGEHLQWATGLFAGTPTRVPHATEWARAHEFVPTQDWWRPHPEWVGRLSWVEGEEAAHQVFDTTGGKPRFAASLSAAVDFRPAAGRDFAARVAPELRMLAHRTGWQLVAWMGSIPQNPEVRSLAGGLTTGAVGLDVTGTVVPHRYLHLSAHIGLLHRTDAYRGPLHRDELEAGFTAHVPLVKDQLLITSELHHRQIVGVRSDIALLLHAQVAVRTGRKNGHERPHPAGPEQPHHREAADAGAAEAPATASRLQGLPTLDHTTSPRTLLALH